LYIYNQEVNRLFIVHSNQIIMKKKNLLSNLFVIVSLVLFMGCQTGTADDQTAQDNFSKGKVAVLVAEGFHDSEAYLPIGYLLNQGYHITVIGPERGTVKAYNSEFTINIDKAVSEVSPDDFHALILPGGSGPAVLRENEDVINFVSEFWQTGKVTAAICHGPQVLVTAGLLDGRTSTGTGGIRGELEEAGATFVDQPVMVDGNLITSRNPNDLYVFSESIAIALREQQQVTGQ
jgi:protease I